MNYSRSSKQPLERRGEDEEEEEEEEEKEEEEMRSHLLRELGVVQKVKRLFRNPQHSTQNQPCRVEDSRKNKVSFTVKTQ